MRARLLLLAVVLLAVGLTGCLTGETDAPQDPGGGNDSDLFIPEADDGSGSGSGSGSNASSSAPVPALSAGLSWRYEVSGPAAHASNLTIVVARSNGSGYLFAGASPRDLAAEVHWDAPWFGRQSLELNPSGEDERRRLFDFPLIDGKGWSWGEGTVAAERTTLETPLGTLDGYRMTLHGTETNRTWTYAPRVGYLVSYTEGPTEAPTLRLTLAGLEARSNATWYRALAGYQVDGGGPPGSVQADNATAIAVSLVGNRGSQATLMPPTTSGQGPTVYQIRDAEGWIYDRVPAVDGEWTLATTPPPEGAMRASMLAVQWPTIQIGDGGG